MNNLNFIIKRLIKENKENIISIIQFGSQNKGEKSDHDIFILLKKRRDIAKIIKTIRKNEKLVHLSHTPFTYFLESHFLVSNDYAGMHSILLGEDELTKEFKPKSLRLRMITHFLLSYTLLLHNIKRQYKVLYGKDILKNIKIPGMTNKDKWLSFPLSYIVLCCALFALPNKNTFKIWCFKATKYYVENIKAYTKKKNQVLDLKIYKLAKRYRYHPEQYKESVLSLYFSSWKSLIKNTFVELR